MAYEQHQQESQKIVARCAIITLSDTRRPESDAGGNQIRQLLTTHGHQLIDYQLIPDDPAALTTLLQTLLAKANIDVILTNGGTGISPRDQTIDIIDQTLQQRLPGFGELFRMLSWEQIGSGAMLSRALAGIANKKLIFALPGSPKAVELAMIKLILPELRHLLHELRK